MLKSPITCAPNLPNMTSTEITLSTPAVIDNITTVETNNTEPYSHRTVESLVSASTYQFPPSTSSYDNHTSLIGNGCFTLRTRIENSRPLKGSTMIERLNKTSEFVANIPDIVTTMEKSTNPIVSQYGNSLLKIQAKQRQVNSSVSKKAKAAYETNLRAIKNLLPTINDKNLIIFFNSILAIYEAKTSKVLKETMAEIDGYRAIIKKQPNKNENLIFFWRGIIGEERSAIKDFLVKFDLWKDFEAEVKNILNNIDDDFSERQEELYDKLKTLCAPMSLAEENENILSYKLFIKFTKDQTITKAIESLQKNQGLIYVLKCTEHGKKLLKQLNDFTTLFYLDEREKNNNNLKTKIEEKRREHNELKKTDKIKRWFKDTFSSNQNIYDLESQLRASIEHSLSIAAEQDPMLKILSEFSPARMDNLLRELKKDKENCNNVITAIAPSQEANKVIPEFMTDNLSVFEAICVAHALDNTRQVAENIHDIEQLYRIMKKKFLHPEIIDQLTFNRSDHQGNVIIKGLMLAALRQFAADADMDWIAQINILLGFADDQHATLTDASKQKVRLRDNYEINHFVKVDHFDQLKPGVSAKINKKILRTTFQQSIKHDRYLINLLDKNDISKVEQKITSEMVDFLLCEGSFIDTRIKPMTFRTNLASLFKLTPQIFLSDMDKIGYTPLLHKTYHAKKTENLLTPLQMASVDHLTVIHQRLQEVVSETVTTLEYAKDLLDDDIFSSLNELDQTAQQALQFEFEALIDQLRKQPYDSQLKTTVKEQAEVILDAVNISELKVTCGDEFLKNIAAMHNYFSSLLPKDITNFYSWMQKLGLPLSNSSQEYITQYLTEILKKDEDDTTYCYKAMSVIVRELFASPLLSDLDCTPKNMQSVEHLNKLSRQSLDQIDQILQGVIDKTISPLNPENKQTDRNQQAFCEIIDIPNSIEEALNELIIKPNIKNTSEKKARLTNEQYNFLKEGLYDLFKLGSDDYGKDIDKFFESMKESAITKSENDIKYLYNNYMNFLQAYGDSKTKKTQELFEDMVQRDLEKAIPALIAMGNLDGKKRLFAMKAKEIQTLGKMNVPSHTDFLKKLNDMYRISSSIYFDIIRLKGGLPVAIDIRAKEIKYLVKRIRDITFSNNAAAKHTMFQKMGGLYYDDDYFAKYRKNCEHEDAIRDQRKIDDRNKKDLWDEKMKRISIKFHEKVKEFSDEFVYWWTPVYIVYKTNVSDSHKSVIIFSNGQLFQSEDCHIYDGAIKMLRAKRVDIMKKKGKLDQGKILAFIKRYDPNFKFVNLKTTRKEKDYQIMSTLENKKGYHQEEVATITQTQTVHTTIGISTIPGDFTYGYPKYYPSPDDPQYVYKEFFFQPDIPEEVTPAVATRITEAKQTWLPSTVANVPSLPDDTSSAPIASTSAFSMPRPSDPIIDKIRNMVSPFMQYHPDNLQSTESDLVQMQAHLSHTIKRDIITINSNNQMNCFQPDGAHVLLDERIEISDKDARQGNYAIALPDALLHAVTDGKTVLLCEDRQHQFNAIDVQLTDNGFISSKIPHGSELRDSIINNTFNDFPESLKPAAQTLFSAVMNVGYTHFYGERPQNDIPTITLQEAFLELLNKTYEQEQQPGTSGYLGN